MLIYITVNLVNIMYINVKSQSGSFIISKSLQAFLEPGLYLSLPGHGGSTLCVTRQSITVDAVLGEEDGRPYLQTWNHVTTQLKYLLFQYQWLFFVTWNPGLK